MIRLLRRSNQRSWQESFRRELEREGFIVSVPGKGSYVAGKNLDFIREEQLRRIEEHMQKIVELSVGCSLGLDDLKDMLELIYRGE